MIDPEFSEQEVRDIVAAALKSLNEDGTVPLSFSDSDILQRLYHLLPRYVGTYSDAQYIISQLREEIYQGRSSLSAQQLHTITRNCTRCPAAISRAELPLWNIADPDLLLVVENPYVIRNQPDIDLLVGALKSAGFNSQRVGLTYATRCGFPVKSIGPSEFANCSRYLYNEIHILHPKLTIAFGSAVYGILTGDTNAKIKELKGDIIWLGITPIMPTFSLGYFHRAYSDRGDTVSYLESDFRKAYAFCYGD